MAYWFKKYDGFKTTNHFSVEVFTFQMSSHAGTGTVHVHNAQAAQVYSTRSIELGTQESSRSQVQTHGRNMATSEVQVKKNNNNSGLSRNCL